MTQSWVASRVETTHTTVVPLEAIACPANKPNVLVQFRQIPYLNNDCNCRWEASYVEFVTFSTYI